MARSRIGARPCLLAVMVLASSGCYRTSDAFAHRWAKLLCVNAKECDNDAFYELYEDVPDCRDDVEDQVQEELDYALQGECEYIAEKGRECIHQTYWDRKDCSEDGEMRIVEACDAIVVCPRSSDAGQLMLPVALDPS